MFTWAKIAVAGVILFAGTVINVDAGFIEYASGSALISNVVDYGDYTKCDRQAHFTSPIRNLFSATEKTGAFNGFRGSLSYYSRDPYFQHLGTGFINEFYGHNADVWKNSHLRDNYRFPCSWRYNKTNCSHDIETAKDNSAAVPEPGVQNFIVLGLFAMFLIPAGMLKTRQRITEQE